MSIKDDVGRVNAEHPDWTAKQIADHLRIAAYHVYNNLRSCGLKAAPAPLPVPATPQPDAETFPSIGTPSSDAVDITVLATKPHEMAAAQQTMIDWSVQKVKESEADLSDATASLEIAVNSGWRIEALERVVNKAGKMVTFYDKIRAALSAGYYIVPPFPLDIFTIRTDRKRPDKKTSTFRWHQHLQQPQLLPAGTGRYVSDEPIVFERTFPGAGSKGEDVKEFFAESFRDVAFPFAIAKPQVMEATAAAMALKVFDRLGALPHSRALADPIICGQILKPDEAKTPVTFFIAWWLDTKTL